ncbi:hypothetical protein K5X82_10335 [Halosquirtibacter xylanolyticus]|uniref:hypothetical protein n=1 Tax=Halosquirtibacter xylanolyticus TaxID=3374599 RepID=UPI00374990D1|nr:hypothetical protein K5X82_10335 [Prolixibacteraceae bacterium]
MYKYKITAGDNLDAAKVNQIVYESFPQAQSVKTKSSPDLLDGEGIFSLSKSSLQYLDDISDTKRFWTALEYQNYLQFVKDEVINGDLPFEEKVLLVNHVELMNAIVEWQRSHYDSLSVQDDFTDSKGDAWGEWAQCAVGVIGSSMTGSLAGGAAIGSGIPGAGTLAGGIVGFAVGGFWGGFSGTLVGAATFC